MENLKTAYVVFEKTENSQKSVAAYVPMYCFDSLDAANIGKDFLDELKRRKELRGDVVNYTQTSYVVDKVRDVDYEQIKNVGRCAIIYGYTDNNQDDDYKCYSEPFKDVRYLSLNQIKVLHDAIVKNNNLDINQIER